MSALFVYIICASSEEAEKIGRTLVEERLAACANILPQHQSIYRWEGKVETAQEGAMICKTPADAFGNLKKKVLELHSYECPCIVAWPIEKGYKHFMNWVEEQTQNHEKL